MELSFEERVLMGNDGQERVAGFLICDECHGDAWKVFSFGPEETSHLMCAACGVVYCKEGCCGEEGTRIN